MTETQRSVGLAVVFGLGKLLLMKLSADARVQGDTSSFSLALVRGVMGGANFVCGAASALQRGLALSSRVARLSRAGWTLGAALVYFVLLHLVGRKLFVGNGLDAFHVRVRQIKHQREQAKKMNKAKKWQRIDVERQAKEAAAFSDVSFTAPAATGDSPRGEPEPEPEPEKVAPPAPEPELEPPLAGGTSYTVG